MARAPGRRSAIAETQDELHLHLNRAGDAANEANQMGAPPFRRHEIRKRDPAVRRFEDRLQRVGQISA